MLIGLLGLTGFMVVFGLHVRTVEAGFREGLLCSYRV